MSCVKCALDLGLDTLRDYKGSIKTGVMVLVTGDQSESINLGNITQIVRSVPVTGFVVNLADGRIPDELYKLAAAGQVWGVSSSLEGHSVTSYLSELMMSVTNRVEEVNIVKIHSQIYYQNRVEATFSLEYGFTSEMFVMLTIDDEMKVEQFDLTDPSGNVNIFSHFDTGAVYFRVTNVTGVGVWTYRQTI